MHVHNLDIFSRFSLTLVYHRKDSLSSIFLPTFVPPGTLARPKRTVPAAFNAWMPRNPHLASHSLAVLTFFHKRMSLSVQQDNSIHIRILSSHPLFRCIYVRLYDLPVFTLYLPYYSSISAVLDFLPQFSLLSPGVHDILSDSFSNT